jgi:hypothetical protein
MFKVEGYRSEVMGDGNWISNFGLRIYKRVTSYRLQVDVET